MNRNMPAAPSGRPLAGVSYDVSPKALSRWDESIAAKETESDNSISILDVIGFDPWTGEGTTAKRIAGALRSIGAERDVVVNINSPGGDMFEGLAIYNMLREHKGNVTVKVLGIAASAASIIAMAGNEVQIARAGFLMIHNAWILAMGNRHDMREAADFLEPFDRAMADIYAARTDESVKTIQNMMDDETYIGGSDAVDQGFADSLLPSDEIGHKAKADLHATRRVDVALAKAGMPRTERRKLLQAFSTPSAAEAGTQDAADDTPSAVFKPEGAVTNVSSQLTQGVFP